MTTTMRAVMFLLSMFVFRGVASAQNKWPMAFSDGTVVDVLAIADNAAATQWWAADGSEAEDPRFRSSSSMSIDSGPETRPLQIVLQMGGPAAPAKNLSVQLQGGGDSMLPKMIDSTGKLYKFIIMMPAKQPTMNLRIGLAGGALGEQVLWDHNGVAPTQPADAAVKFVSIDEQDGQTVVQLTRVARKPAVKNGAPPLQSMVMSSGMMSGTGGGMRFDDIFGGADARIEVIAAGKHLSATGMQSSGTSLTLRFRCRKNQADKVIFISRPYEWMEMKNVSTMPSATPTKVEVLRAALPTTAP